MNKYWLAKSNENIDEYILVFRPDVQSINSFIDKIDYSSLKDGSKVRCDLIVFVGDRSERFLEFNIIKGTVELNTIIKGNKNNEVINVTKKIYSNLPLGYISKIYPIEYRNEIIKIKEEALKASS